MADPSRDPWHRRGWAYMDRPRRGFGCLWIATIVFITYLILALLFTPFRFY